MEVIINNKTSFSSRNKTIRKADDIIRLANKNFARRSPSLTLSSIKTKELPPSPYRKLWGTLGAMRKEKERKYESSKTFSDRVKALIDPIRKYKIGNCGESADLALIAAKANGIQNCLRARLVTPSGEEYDHAIVFVQDKKPYILDAWLGFADYVPNAMERYRKEFRHLFDFDEVGTEKIKIANSEKTSFSNSFTNREFSDTEIKEIQQLYPELILKQKT